MAFMHRVSGWLGRLSAGRKLMLIYLLDLTAVIYVSSILIHEKTWPSTLRARRLWAPPMRPAATSTS